jgi:hypothetical protein
MGAKHQALAPTDLDLVRYAAQAYTVRPTWQRGDVSAVAFPQPDSHTVVVAWPGSDNIHNWFRDLDAWPTWHPHLGFCHRGFFLGAMALAEQIRRDTAGSRLVFCGHSLGASLATITAAHFLVQGTPVDILTLFGLPRPGGRKLARVLCHGVRRFRSYRHVGDPVPDVPWLPFLYVQPTAMVVLHGDASPWWLTDHMIDRYELAMTEWMA